MGGEKTKGGSPEKSGPGSPPRGRGKVSSVSMCTRSPGITPAWAGKRFQSHGAVPFPGDHPRVGGEKTSADRPRIADIGSPPRGRGKAEIESYADECDRITPAWAGKSCRSTASSLSARDHPRVGGEKVDTKAKVHRQGGSPPRGRGKAVRPDRKGHGQGITPAWAGKSQIESFGQTLSKDHPRVGGEKLKRLRKAYKGKGSPPRGRGKEPR